MIYKSEYQKSEHRQIYDMYIFTNAMNMNLQHTYFTCATCKQYSIKQFLLDSLNVFW